MDRAQKTSIRICPIGKNEGKLCYSPDDVRKAAMSAYYQAERDLALTWEDVKWLFDTAYKFTKINTTPMTDEEFCKEVLKRFLESKKV